MELTKITDLSYDRTFQLPWTTRDIARKSAYKCESASAIALECVFTTLSMIGVALLGWSSFEFDPVQINGTNSTVTPGLRTAGVVISSVCIGIPFIVSTVLGCVFLCGTSDCTKNIIDRLVKAVKKRIKKTKETEEARLRRSKSLLEEALKHGFVTCRTVVCLLVGVAGAGKTHTQHLLLKKNPPKSRTSTPIAVKPVRAVLVSAKSGELQEVSIDHLDKILAATVATGVSLKDITSWCRCFGNDSQTTSKGISQPPPSSGQEVDLEEKPVATSHNNSFWYCCLAPLDSDSQRLLETTKAALDKTAHQIATTSGPQQLLNGDWIYLIDSGGQIEFLEVLPAFLRHTSVCLFVANLSEELSNRPKIEYYEDGKPVGEPTLCPFTNEQMLMRCVQTIQTQCNIQEGSTNQGQGSKLAMIGTHRDCEDQCSEKREEKNQKLHSKLSPIFGQNLIFYGQKMKELIFPVNAKTPDAEDHEVAKELTKEILKVASSLEPRKTPISWFEFEKHIHMLGRKLLHWKECLRLARMLHLSKRNLDAALDHLASFGVIHYYPHLLPDVVFVDPQFLLDKISELVKFHYKLRCNPDPHTATQGELQKFRNEGCITLKLLKQFPEQYTDFFTPADFLKLMNDRLITAHLINEDEYFMPCLLRTIELEEVDQYRVTTSGVAPLAIHFPCQLVPHGVFCSLVAFLQSSQNSSPWRLSLCPTDHSEPLCLTRNCIKFQLPESAPGSLTLIDTFSHFEVYVDAPYDVCANLCLSIQHTLFRGIQKAAKTLGYHQLDPKLAFLCTECKNIQPHLALPADALDYWKCEHKPATVYGKLTDEHLVWCPEEGVHMEAQPRPVSQKHQRHKEEVQLPLKTLSEMSEGVLMEEAQPIALSKKHKRVEAPNEVHIPLETYSEAQRGMQAPPTEVHVVLEVPSEIKEATTDCPTLVECIRFRGLERMINIAEKISTKYHDFGLLLLDDHNGTRVRNMELKHREDPERINKEILQEWATGRGKQPVSWKTLIEVLRDIELDTLASEIEAVKEL